LNNSTTTEEESLSEIQIEKQLASGHFGAVYKGIWQNTTSVALKALFVESKNEFESEMKMLM
jgi:predicted Ser/Thr protein kinase